MHALNPNTVSGSGQDNFLSPSASLLAKLRVTGRAIRKTIYETDDLQHFERRGSAIGFGN